MGELQQVTNSFDLTAVCKVTELFCIIDEFCKHFDAENLLEDNSGVKRRRRQASLSDSEIIAQFPLLGLTRDLHPLDNAHAERTKKGLQSRLTLKTSSKEGSHLLSRIAVQYHRRKRA